MWFARLVTARGQISVGGLSYPRSGLVVNADDRLLKFQLFLHLFNFFFSFDQILLNLLEFCLALLFLQTLLVIALLALSLL